MRVCEGFLGFLQDSSTGLAPSQPIFLKLITFLCRFAAYAFWRLLLLLTARSIQLPSLSDLHLETLETLSLRLNIPSRFTGEVEEWISLKSPYTPFPPAPSRTPDPEASTLLARHDSAFPKTSPNPYPKPRNPNPSPTLRGRAGGNKTHPKPCSTPYAPRPGGQSRLQVLPAVACLRVRERWPPDPGPEGGSGAV